MTRSAVSVPPTPDELENALRLAQGRAAVEKLTLKLKIVTPMLGGSPRTRELDDVDIVRVPSIRGQLRFWWRALYGHRHETPQELYAAEAALWGGVAGVSRASSVLIQVLDASEGLVDASEPAQDGTGYALFPARSQAGNNPRETARRRRDAVFSLSVAFPRVVQDEVTNALRAFVHFGGLGARTRRGLGSLEDTAGDHFVGGPASLIGPVTAARSFPSLHGAELLIGKPAATADAAWATAISWLKDFRQGTGSTANFARNTGKPAGRSRWPEPDVIRDRTGRRATKHPLYYAGRTSYPRAQFGLPIVGRFGDGAGGDPGPFTIVARSGTQELDRFASALILKGLRIDGKFRPAALWLHRAAPAGLQFGIAGRPASFVPAAQWPDGSGGMFFEPLTRATSTREAFFLWLTESKRAERLR